MQLMPIMESLVEQPLLESKQPIDPELFLSLLLNLAQSQLPLPTCDEVPDAQATEDLLPICHETAKAQMREQITAELALQEDEETEDQTTLAALLGLVATLEPVKQDPMFRQELDFLPEVEFASGEIDHVPKKQLYFEENPELFELLEKLMENPKLALSQETTFELLKPQTGPIELSPQLRQELEVLVSQNQKEGEAPKQSPLEKIQVGQASEIILNSLPPAIRPRQERLLSFALFPQVDFPDEETVELPQVQPLLYTVPPIEQEEETISRLLTQTEVPGEEPEEVPRQELPKPQELGFVSVSQRREVVAGKVEAPPQPQEPFSFEQVMARATVRVGKEIQELAVKIRPQGLGRVLMQVAVEDGQLVAKFFTESNQAKGILELNLPQLRESLAQEGLVLERCQVALGWSQDFGQQQRQEQRPRYRPPRKVISYEEHLTASEPAEQVGLVNFIA